MIISDHQIRPRRSVCAWRAWAALGTRCSSSDDTLGAEQMEPRSPVPQVRAVCAQLFGSPDARPIMLGGRPFGICDDLHLVLGAQAGLDDVRRAGEVAKKLLQSVSAQG